MRAWLIYDKFEAVRNRHYIQMYFDECSRRSIDLSLLLVEDMIIGVKNDRCIVLYKGSELQRPDFAICRAIKPLLTKQLELMGIPVFNNYQVASICNDKRKTYQYVSQANVPVMDTIFAHKGFSGEIRYPAVVKPAFGKGGRDVYLVRDPRELKDALDRIPDPEIVIQRAASDLGRDLRVYVIGRRIIAAMLRVSETDFRSNFCLGGRACIYDLDDDERRMVEDIISLFDFGLVGIDFIFHKGKPVFNEIEDVVGSRMLFAHTDINIVSEYLDFILGKMH
ncbi:MAG TPA: ATP-grasp domain-containing protein [Candidatus Atribacteria bacterium]|nr:ATP-grasp domain-containing protein [Candidatus Atribacteria bacterium]